MFELTDSAWPGRLLKILAIIFVCVTMISSALSQPNNDHKSVSLNGIALIHNESASNQDYYSRIAQFATTLFGINDESTNNPDYYIIFSGSQSEGNQLSKESESQVKLGLVALDMGLSLPDEKFWVNLNPTEPDRIVEKELAGTDVGRIMLEADLQMKKDFAKYENPCKYDTGRTFWTLLEAKRDKLANALSYEYPSEIENASNVHFSSAIRNWIVPGKIYVYEDNQGMYIINSSLSINQEPAEDYSSYSLDNQSTLYLSNECIESLNRSAKEYGQYSAELQKEMMLPLVVKEINEERRYSDLRKVYRALAIAQWYKDKYHDRIRGLKDLSGSWERPWDPRDTWGDYVTSFREGDVTCWQTKTLDNTTVTTYNLTDNNMYKVVHYYNYKILYNNTTSTRGLGTSAEFNEIGPLTEKKFGSYVDPGEEPRYESMQETSYETSSQTQIYTVGGVDYSAIKDHINKAGSFDVNVGKEFNDFLEKTVVLDPKWTKVTSNGITAAVLFEPSGTSSFPWGKVTISSWYVPLLKDIITRTQSLSQSMG